MSYAIQFLGNFHLDRQLTLDHFNALNVAADVRYDAARRYACIFVHTPPDSNYCYWRPAVDGWSIKDDWDREGTRYDYVEWLEWLIKEYLSPWGYKLNGRVDAFEEGDGVKPEVWGIFVRDNEVRVSEGRIVIDDPFEEKE